MAPISVLPQFIDGRLVHEAGGDPIDVHDPATGEVIARAVPAPAALVDEAVQAAERAFPSWADTPPAEREGVLRDFADVLQENLEELAAMESTDTGKPLATAREEIELSLGTLRFFAGAARVPEGKAATEYVRGRTSMIRRDPIGVCGQIAPWNYPFMMAVWKIGPALATGNTVVLKPSELTPLTTVRMAGLAGGVLPPGAFNVITGDGLPTGDALVRHPRVRLVSLTGDTSTGRTIARNAADNLKRVHLELGGKAPVVVFADADLNAVTDALRRASFANSGQDCTAATRVLVEDSVYEDLMAALLPKVASLRVGDPRVPGTEMGPVISGRQRERILGFVERAAEQGATVLTGGGAVDRPGYFVTPTVITDVEPGYEISRREVFGPVITVQRFSGEAEALALACGPEYGLASSVWSRDIGRCLRMARTMQFGCVWLNDHMTLVDEMPHGGFKQSGYGKDLSVYALEDYTVVKHVMANLD